jgi:tight adherence protein C
MDDSNFTTTATDATRCSDESMTALVFCAVIACIGLVLAVPAQPAMMSRYHAYASMPQWRISPQMSERLRLLEMSRTAFDRERMIWGIASALVALLLVTLRGEWMASPVIAPLAFVLGLLLRDRQLREEVKKAEVNLASEVATVAELLALCVTAGQTPISAIQRICETAEGPVIRALRGSLAEIHAGATLVSALSRVRNDFPSADFQRFVDALILAMERGTALAPTLLALAVDASEGQRRALMQRAGKSEIAMMIPVVFIIMPISVIFALWPSLNSLTLS